MRKAGKHEKMISLGHQGQLEVGREHSQKKTTRADKPWILAHNKGASRRPERAQFAPDCSNILPQWYIWWFFKFLIHSFQVMFCYFCSIDQLSDRKYPYPNGNPQFRGLTSMPMGASRKSVGNTVLRSRRTFSQTRRGLYGVRKYNTRRVQ